MLNVYKDELTHVFNEKYLNDHYQRYLKRHKNSNFIMIDIKKFKSINDVFGHDMGDNYLCLLSKVLKDNFKDSIVVRLHGDEFAIVTKYQENKIKKVIDSCHEQIKVATKDEQIPKELRFNAGLAPCDQDLNETRGIADYMMYYAKSRNRNIQFFSDRILKLKVKQDNYLKEIDSHLSNRDFSYSTRELFDKNGNGTSVYQLYTKSRNGDPILISKEYEFLRNTSRIFGLDMYNVNVALERIPINSKLIMNVDYKSLILNDDIVKYFSKNSGNRSLSNIILSVDINKINSGYFKDLNKAIDTLGSLGIKVGIDNFNSSIGDVVFENDNIDYIKILNTDWKKRMGNCRLQKMFELKNQMFCELGIIPIYDNVTNRAEYEFLKKLDNDNLLMLGDYFSKEKKLILKK